MSSIESWLKKFKNSWERTDVDAILELFSVDVIYFETPFRQVKNFEELKKEWLAIKKQKDINLKYKLFTKAKNKYAVLWSLTYFNESNEKQNFAGTYLIELDNDDVCVYFHHTCEEK